MKRRPQQRFVPTPFAGHARTAPWAGPQVVAVATANAAAVGLAVAAWWAASGTGRATDQVRWSTVGLLGVVIALAFNGWFLARSRQAVRMAQRALFTEPCFAPYRTERIHPSANGNGTLAGPIVAGKRHVTVPGTSRYHRSSCALVAGKDIDEAPRSVHDKAGRQACEVCEP